MTTDLRGEEFRLAEVLKESALQPLSAEQLDKFAAFASLLLRWNARMNLTAIRSLDGIVRRHFAESIACAQALPENISDLLDLGSGAGFPGIPIAICRSQVAVTLAESQGKKVSFLREATRVLDLPCRVYGGRAETIAAHFDCVTLRAVDKMGSAVALARGLLKENGLLVILTSTTDMLALQEAAGPGFQWETSSTVPGSGNRVLLTGRLST